MISIGNVFGIVDELSVGKVFGNVFGIIVGNVFGFVEGGVDEDFDRSALPPALPCRKPCGWPVGDVSEGAGAIGDMVGWVFEIVVGNVVDRRVDRDRTAAVVGSIVIDVDKGSCRNRSDSCNGLFPRLSGPKGSCDAGDGILSCCSGRFECQIWGRIPGH